MYNGGYLIQSSVLLNDIRYFWVFFLPAGPISRKSRKLFEPEMPFQKRVSAYSKRLAFYYDFKRLKGNLLQNFIPGKVFLF